MPVTLLMGRKRQKDLWDFLVANQAELVSSRLREKPCGKWLRKILNVAHLGFHIYVHAHKCVNKHTLQIHTGKKQELKL